MKFDEFRLAAIYDTETTNIGENENTRAFPILFIVNDVRGVDISNYHVWQNDNFKLYRHEGDMLDYIATLIEDGMKHKYVPVIAAYNLMFDMQPLMEELSARYYIKVCAQSSTHVYTLDLCNEDGKKLLRFWDTFYLEMRGLEAMGETCGLYKLKGSWDYNAIRTPNTPLTEDEIAYAKRDVQVIPAYLKYLLQANDWLKQSDFGCRVLTKTSLVRQMAKRSIGNKRVTKENGKQITQSMMFSKICMQELPKTFDSYGIRKACFRGGLTFTASRYSMQVVNNVASMDVTSMHHAFINGRFIPVQFKDANKQQLTQAFEYIVNLSLSEVLESYERPTLCAFHMLVRLDNIRLKKGTVFERCGIAMIPSAKFRVNPPKFDEDIYNNDANLYIERLNRENGHIDVAFDAEFAFGKLYKAGTCYIHITELELLALNMVYEWDDFECISGELTRKFNRPPDYVTLQSNMLYAMKDNVKDIIKHYKYGTKYEGYIADTIPPDIALNLRNGCLSEDFLQSYYNSTVKGMFNSIYGTMAQDIYKPDYVVDNEGNIFVDTVSKPTEASWSSIQPQNAKVLYTYGMRIVGGSRLHLVIAMQLLNDKLGDKIDILAGDTDSLKVRCNANVTDEKLMQALKPLHNAIVDAIDITQERVRETHPDMTSELENVGCFEIEGCGNSTRYPYHMEAWNKARISIDDNDAVHVTCAGLSRPPSLYSIANFIEDMLKTHEPSEILPLCLGFNTRVSNELSHALQRHSPKTTDVFDNDVTDYLGNTAHVESHESIALYEVDRLLGDITKDVNARTVEYLETEYNNYVDDREKILYMKDGTIPTIYYPLYDMSIEGKK